MKLNLISIFTLLACLWTGLADAQVTIGSDETPLAGALLDLKEKGTTTKGLGLPRVELNTLKPQTNKLAESIGGVSGTTPWNEDVHIGLVVYNAKAVSPICKNGILEPGIVEGVHVWDGTEWQSLLLEEAGAIDVRTVSYPSANKMKMEYIKDGTTKESEEYYIADFGTAGTWMTQNLRTKYSPDGTALAMTGNQTVNGLDPITGKPQKVAGYPSNTDNSDPSNYNANVAVGNQIGLLYDWHTATDHLNCSVLDQRQATKFSENSGAAGAHEVETVETTGYIKGICPTGWHMPSDREWNLLEKELTEQADNYANGTYTSPKKTWTDGWETAEDWRGNITGQVMKSTTKIEHSTGILSNMDSKTSSQGGFDVFMTSQSNTAAWHGYGWYTYFWTTSTAGATWAWYRNLTLSNQDVKRFYHEREFLASVRCKKD